MPKRWSAGYLLLLCCVSLEAQPQAIISSSTKNATSRPLRTYSIPKPRTESAIIHRDIHRVKPLPRPKALEHKLARDKALQTAPMRKLHATVVVKDGLGDGGYQVGAEPPDTVGAAGSTQFVQWVNTAVQVFDKNSLLPLAPPADGNSLWTGFGGNCEAFNDGDPVVLYDRIDPHDGRWVLSQFAVSGGDPDQGKPYSQCIAISKTDDALGEYYLYEFQFKNFNDYGKLGVWRDGYYGSFNMFDKNNNFLGTQACAFQRDAMRKGLAAQMECFEIPGLGGLLPADLDGGSPPPESSPEYFLNFDFSGDKLNLWKFKASWDNHSPPAIEGPTPLMVSSFNPACDSCVTQLGSPTMLNTLGDRVMFRLGYRNLGNNASLITNHAVGVGGFTAIRWYELALGPDSTAPVQVKQQGTFRPSTAHRWMGSMAMDKSGNIAIGYSKSSAQIYPSIMLTGRSASEPQNILNSEITIMKGSGSQNGVDRWGDYSSMTIDPVDDCTFYYTTLYLTQVGQYNWHTAIAKIKFPGCT